MDVYLLEQSEADVPEGNAWLSARELDCMNRLRFAKRRADWRLGRWTAKCALADYLNDSTLPAVLANIEILASESGAPEILLGNKLSAIPISLSHRDGMAVCALAPSGGALGCDLETIEPRSDAFVTDYFTAEEQALVAQASAADRFRLLALLWSAKESTLKVLRTGLRLDTRSVIVSLDSALQAGEEDHDGWSEESAPANETSSHFSCWRPLSVRHMDGQTFRGWWQQAGNLLRTVVSAPPPGPPIVLARTHCAG